MAPAVCLGKGLLSVELPLTIAIGLLMFGVVALIFPGARAPRAMAGARKSTARPHRGAILTGAAVLALSLCCSVTAKAETSPPALQPGTSIAAQEVAAGGAGSSGSAASRAGGSEADLKLPDLSS